MPLTFCSECALPADPGRLRCRPCLDESRKEMARAVAAGKCRGCRSPNPDAGRRLLCPTCRVANNATQQRRRAARLSAGHCCQCDSPPLPGKTRCGYHHRMLCASQKKHAPKREAKRKARIAGRQARQESPRAI